MDYQSVNKDTVPDCYPLPHIDELVDAIGNQKAAYFTLLDLIIRLKWLKSLKRRQHLLVIRGYSSIAECHLA